MASVDTLKNEIEKLKEDLSHTDVSIKRIIGRDRENRPTFPNRIVSLNDEAPPFLRKNDRFIQKFNGPPREGINRKRLSSGLIAGPPRQRQLIMSSNNVSRNNAEEEEDDYQTHMTLASSVIATNKDSQSREEIIKQQNIDKEGSARNRRMFGLIMGTLRQFKMDERKNEMQEKKRKEVEMKLEEKQKNEKAKIRMEKDKLFHTKKQQQIKLKKLELKMEIVELHEIWEEQSKQLMNFIRTDSKPNIYYLPKHHTEASLKKLESSRKLIEAIVTKRRNVLNEDIKKVLNTEHFDDMDDGEEEQQQYGSRPSFKNDRFSGRTNRTNNRVRRHDTATKDNDDFDLDLNKNEVVVGVDYQPSTDHTQKIPSLLDKNGDEDNSYNNNDDNDGGDQMDESNAATATTSAADEIYTTHNDDYADNNTNNNDGDDGKQDDDDDKQCESNANDEKMEGDNETKMDESDTATGMCGVDISDKQDGGGDNAADGDCSRNDVTDDNVVRNNDEDDEYDHLSHDENSLQNDGEN